MSPNQETTRGHLFVLSSLLLFVPTIICAFYFSFLFCRVRNFASKQQKSKKGGGLRGGEGGALWSISGEQGVKKGCYSFHFYSR